MAQVSHFVHFLPLYIFKMRNRLIEVSLYFVLLKFTCLQWNSRLKKKIRLEAHKFLLNFILHLVEANWILKVGTSIEITLYLNFKKVHSQGSFSGTADRKNTPKYVIEFESWFEFLGLCPPDGLIWRTYWMGSGTDNHCEASLYSFKRSWKDYRCIRTVASPFIVGFEIRLAFLFNDKYIFCHLHVLRHNNRLDCGDDQINFSLSSVTRKSASAIASLIHKVTKGAKIRNRYNQVSNLT